MTKAERARELFLEGCNCAQAVFLAFAEEKMDRDTALKIASGFGGGMAGMRNVCGAVNGMFMAYGLLCGPADPTDRAAKAKSYETLRQLAGEFEARNGSLICRQLLGLDPDFKPTGLYASEDCKTLWDDSETVLAEGDIDWSYSSDMCTITITPTGGKDVPIFAKIAMYVKLYYEANMLKM